MNRVEAKSILNAYITTIELYGHDDEAAKAMESFILYMMTNTTYYPCISIQKTYADNTNGVDNG